MARVCRSAKYRFSSCHWRSGILKNPRRPKQNVEYILWNTNKYGTGGVEQVRVQLQGGRVESGHDHFRDADGGLSLCRGQEQGPTQEPRQESGHSQSI